MLQVGGFNEVRKIEIHKAELLEPELSDFESEIATEKIKITRIYLIPAEQIKAGDRTFVLGSMSLSILYVITRNYSCSESIQSLHAFRCVIPFVFSNTIKERVLNVSKHDYFS